MKLERVHAVVLTALLILTGLFVFQVSEVGGDPVYKQIVGIVNPNSTTGVHAYDPNPALNGFVYFYIQNRTNEGNGMDPMTTLMTWEVYDPEIYLNISDWKVGDVCILVVEREYGSYGTDHAGYIAFTNVTLDDVVGAQSAPTTELQKIPVPSMVSNGTGYIEISWDPLNDPNGLIAGYKVYRSTTNGTVAGDADWTLIGGTVSAPLTVTNYNDTSVIAGETYYYSIKVVFTGYANDNPANVDNYQNQIFGEGSSPLPPPVTPPGIDYILITDGPGGAELTTVDLPVGGTLTAYASGYNLSTGLFVQLVSVDWSGLGGNWLPLTATSSLFTAGWIAGLYTQTGQNVGLGLSDTFDINILPPAIDMIVITDGPNGLELTTVTLPIGGTYTAFASGYNSTTGGYISLVEVNWLDNGGTWAPGLTNSSTFTAGLVDGLYVQTAQNLSMGVSDDFTIEILPPTVDYILITDGPNGAELTTVTLAAGFSTLTAYASGYNNTGATFVGLVEVDWLDLGGGGSWFPLLSTDSVFSAGGTPGIYTLTGQNVSMGVSDDFDVDIVLVNIDSIVITDSPNGTELITVTLPVGGSFTAYASGYNITWGYIGLVEVTWTDVGGTWSPNPAKSSTYTGGLIDGLYGQTAQNFTLGLSDTFDIDILPPTVDYIIIRDAAGGLGNEVTTGIYSVMDVDNFYAAAYNNTILYMYDVEVVWTIAPPGVGSVDSPGLWTNFTAQQVASDSTCTVTATYMGTIIDTTDLLTVLAPRVDYIIVRDAAGGLGNEVTTGIYSVMDLDNFYAAAYNDTILYIYEVEAVWQSDLPGVGSVDSPGLWTNFTAQQVATDSTCTVTATYGTLSDTTDLLTVLAPRIDYIQIEDGMGNVITTMIYGVSDTDEFYAVAYNNTISYLYEVEAVWQSDATSVGTVTTPGLWTNFTAQQVATDSTCTVTATYGTFSDTTGLLTVLAPRVDYIQIMDQPGGVGNIVDTATYWVWGTDNFYAAGYNNTMMSYIGDVEVTWQSDATSVGTVDSPGIWTNFTAQWVNIDSTCTVTATYTVSITDSTGLLTVLTPRVDDITIRDAPNNGGNWIWIDWPLDTFTIYNVGDTDTFWAAGYNITVGYIGDIDVDWTALNTLGFPDTNNGTVVTGPSNSTTFTANSNHGGALIVRASTAGLANFTSYILIMPPTPDEIEIRNAPNRGGSIVTTATFNVGDSDMFYAAGINYTAGYIGDIDVVWTIAPATGVGTVTTPGSSTTFGAVGAGICTVTATNTTYGATNSTGTLTVQGGVPPVDHIIIRDAPDGGGNEVTTATYWVWGTDEFYCAAYDSGGTYLRDVKASWVSNAPLVGQVDSPGHWTNFTAQWVIVDSQCTVTATYDSLTDSTGLLTVLYPRMVEIMIRDTANGGGSVVGARTYWVYENNDDTFYAAGYNKTVGYLDDVLADWESDDDTVGQVTSPGDPTTFTAQEVDADDTCTVTATYQGISNTTGLLTVLYPRVDEIIIRDAQDGGGSVISSETFYVGDTDIFYAAGYNQSEYLEDLADAEWELTGDTIGTVTSPGASTTFTATTENSGTLTASYTYDGTVIEESVSIDVYEVIDIIPPATPTNLTVESKGKDKMEISWDANSESDLAGYILIRATDPNDVSTWEAVTTEPLGKSVTSYTDTDLDPDTTYYYSIIALDESNNTSPQSNWEKGTTEPGEEFPWIWLILFIIIAIVVILLILFLWKKKKKEEEAMPPVGVPPEEAPVEEIPAEEYEELPAEEYEEYEEAPAEEYEEYEEAPGEEYEEEIEYEEEEPETPTTPPPPPPPP